MAAFRLLDLAVDDQYGCYFDTGCQYFGENGQNITINEETKKAETRLLELFKSDISDEYIHRLWDALLERKRGFKRLYYIHSQIKSLNHNLYKLLFKTFGKQKMYSVKEYIWEIKGADLENLKALKINHDMYSADYVFEPLLKQGRVVFNMWIRRASSSFVNNVAVGILIKNTHKFDKLDIQWSYYVRQVNYIHNKLYAANKRKGKRDGYKSFSNQLITKQINVLCIRFALLFVRR